MLIAWECKSSSWSPASICLYKWPSQLLRLSTFLTQHHRHDTRLQFVIFIIFTNISGCHHYHHNIYNSNLNPTLATGWWRVGARIQVTSHQPQIVQTKINSDWSFIKTNHWSTDQALEYQKIRILTVLIWVNNHGTSPDNINLSSPESSERAKMTGILGLHIWLHQQKSPHLSACIYSVQLDNAK